MDRPLKSYRKKAVVKSSTILESTEEGKDSTGSKVECCSRTIHLLFPLSESWERIPRIYCSLKSNGIGDINDF